jgi:hypothetical protein
MIRRTTKPKGEPSDLELMLYADGELDEERRAAVEAFLARSAAGSAKLSALNFVSGIVRDDALAAAAQADDIADAVMAKLTANGAGAASTIHASPIMAPVATGAPLPAPRAKAANDNARGIFAIAAIAVAAAAGLFIWGRMDTSSGTSEHPIAAMTSTPEQLPAPPAPVKAAEATPSADAEDEHGVEVAAVDFGARMGTIFYVPTGSAASNATTTVVWLNDDAAGGE